MVAINSSESPDCWAQTPGSQLIKHLCSHHWFSLFLAYSLPFPGATGIPGDEGTVPQNQEAESHVPLKRSSVEKSCVTSGLHPPASPDLGNSSLLREQPSLFPELVEDCIYPPRKSAFCSLPFCIFKRFIFVSVFCVCLCVVVCPPEKTTQTWVLANRKSLWASNYIECSRFQCGPL